MVPGTQDAGTRILQDLRGEVEGSEQPGGMARLSHITRQGVDGRGFLPVETSSDMRRENPVARSNDATGLKECAHARPLHAVFSCICREEHGLAAGTAARDAEIGAQPVAVFRAFVLRQPLNSLVADKPLELVRYASFANTSRRDTDRIFFVRSGKRQSSGAGIEAADANMDWIVPASGGRRTSAA